MIISFCIIFLKNLSRVMRHKKIRKIQEKTKNSITPSANQAPSINQLTVKKKISRDESINNSDRIRIENENIIGSISLEGGLIDDISFKNHKQKVEGSKNIEFLNPAQTENGFYAESGWASIGNKIKVPTKNSKWKVEGNKVLTDKSPVILKWNNNEGVIFKKKIELDEKYLFKISQEIQNNSSQSVELYPYAQITRNKVPDDIQNFYISHEGFIGVFDDELKEDDYDDIEDNKIVRETNEGWLGITDKYWMTVLVPEAGSNEKKCRVELGFPQRDKRVDQIFFPLSQAEHQTYWPTIHSSHESLIVRTHPEQPASILSYF